MPLGTAAGVHLLAHAAAVPVPAPPGVSVVTTADAVGDGAAIAGALGAGPCLSVDEAAGALERRRAEALEAPAELVRACGASAATTRAALAKARLSLSTVPAGLAAATVVSAARTVAEATEVLLAARHALGGRPGYDDDSAAAARAAQADVEQARLDRAGALPKANRALTVANAGAGLVVLGRMASQAFDGAFFLVALLPVAGLGYAAHAVIAPVRRARAAARRRWSALRSMNVSTLGGLAALKERAGAWERRAARMKAAEADLRQARDEWRSLVGDAVSLTSADRLAADLEAIAALEQAAVAADRAWADAAAALQAAEDTVPAGDPVVVLVPDPSAADDEPTRAVRALCALAGATTVVVVVAGPPPSPLVAVADEEETPAAAGGSDARPEPSPERVPVAVGGAAGDGSGIVDLRERVKAGLLRLRARTASPRDPAQRLPLPSK